MHIKDFGQAIDWLYSYIPHTEKKEFQGGVGLQRQQLLMDYLDNPQEKSKIIHVAGTSGKGSTAFLISTALVSQGFKTGLHLSPHLLDIRERCLINNRYISKERFVQYLNEIIPAVDKVEQSSLEKSTYYEVLVALSYYIMWKEEVDFAVMETGLGGLYDGTNVVNNLSKIAVITQLGLDHMKVLGNTYAKIAAQKAGIIHPGNTVITVSQRESAQEVIKKTAEQNNSTLYILRSGIEYKNIKLSQSGTEFEFHFQNIRTHIKVGMLGEHQAQNAAVALAVLKMASTQYAFEINEKSLSQQFAKAHFLGRMDVRSIEGKTVIFDGAHNPQKMESFLKTLQQLYPDRKFHFLIAFKKGKDSSQMLEKIAPLAFGITFTAFFLDRQDLPHISQDPKELAGYLKNKNIDISIAVSPEDGWKKALAATKDILIVTGSLYLLSELYTLIITRSTDL